MGSNSNNKNQKPTWENDKNNPKTAAAYFSADPENRLKDLYEFLGEVELDSYQQKYSFYQRLIYPHLKANEGLLVENLFTEENCQKFFEKSENNDDGLEPVALTVDDRITIPRNKLREKLKPLFQDRRYALEIVKSCPKLFEKISPKYLVELAKCHVEIAYHVFENRELRMHLCKEGAYRKNLLDIYKYHYDKVGVPDLRMAGKLVEKLSASQWGSIPNDQYNNVKASLIALANFVRKGAMKQALTTKESKLTASYKFLSEFFPASKAEPKEKVKVAKNINYSLGCEIGVRVLDKSFYAGYFGVVGKIQSQLQEGERKDFTSTTREIARLLTGLSITEAAFGYCADVDNFVFGKHATGTTKKKLAKYFMEKPKHCFDLYKGYPENLKEMLQYAEDPIAFLKSQQRYINSQKNKTLKNRYFNAIFSANIPDDERRFFQHLLEFAYKNNKGWLQQIFKEVASYESKEPSVIAKEGVNESQANQIIERQNSSKQLVVYEKENKVCVTGRHHSSGNLTTLTVGRRDSRGMLGVFSEKNETVKKQFGYEDSTSMQDDSETPYKDKVRKKAVRNISDYIFRFAEKVQLLPIEKDERIYLRMSTHAQIESFLLAHPKTSANLYQKCNRLNQVTSYADNLVKLLDVTHSPKEFLKKLKPSQKTLLDTAKLEIKVARIVFRSKTLRRMACPIVDGHHDYAKLLGIYKAHAPNLELLDVLQKEEPRAVQNDPQVRSQIDALQNKNKDQILQQFFSERVSGIQKNRNLRYLTGPGCARRNIFVEVARDYYATSPEKLTELLNQARYPVGFLRSQLRYLKTENQRNAEFFYAILAIDKAKIRGTEGSKVANPYFTSLAQFALGDFVKLHADTGMGWLTNLLTDAAKSKAGILISLQGKSDTYKLALENVISHLFSGKNNEVLAEYIVNQASAMFPALFPENEVGTYKNLDTLSKLADDSKNFIIKLKSKLPTAALLQTLPQVSERISRNKLSKLIKSVKKSIHKLRVNDNNKQAFIACLGNDFIRPRLFRSMPSAKFKELMLAVPIGSACFQKVSEDKYLVAKLKKACKVKAKWGWFASTERKQEAKASTENNFAALITKSGCFSVLRKKGSQTQQVDEATVEESVDTLLQQPARKPASHTV